MRRAAVLLPLLLSASLARATDGPLPPIPPSDVEVTRKLIKALNASDYDAVDAVCDEIAQEGRKKQDYRTRLWAVTQTIPPEDGPLELLDAWCDARPKSHYPFLFRGTVWIKYGWKARGSGYVPSVSDEGKRLLKERLLHAKKDLERAHTLNPKSPLAAASLITTAFGLGLPESTARKYFRWATKADPTDLGAYERLQTYLSPKWGGGRKKMFAFVRESLRKQPDEPALAILLVFAWNEFTRPSPKAFFDGNPKALAEVREAYDQVLKAYPWSEEGLSLRIKLADQVTREDTIAWVYNLASSGQPEAQLGMGISHLESKHYPEALQWLRRAYGNGNRHAGYELGLCYLEGVPGQVEADAKQAWEFFKAAGHARRPEAMYQAGVCRLRGLGVGKNLQQARTWFLNGSRFGEPRAMNSLGVMLMRGDGGPAEPKEAVRWFQKASEAGNLAATNALASCHAGGMGGLTPDPERAAQLYRKALEGGYENARRGLEFLLRENPTLRQAGDP